ncbi:hypothetical protein AVEN_189665-1 [Araneus ventricosus]|uniref:Fibronectin type-III domain-containing protein n=1 Tax=Araneus ventricosus TaxID=182803 RepID=A0A4Y2M0P1_ARAVE|nr:hypothetical protein AVEN_189665-1 [Araneus ventricosus]
MKISVECVDGSFSVLPESVLGYVLYWKEVAMDEIIEYKVVNDVKSPHLLDNLQPQTRYEVYVAARNAFGLSRGSVRVLFKTTPETNHTEKAEEKYAAYNETACCVAAGLKTSCLDLCTYNMKMSDLQLLAIPCANQLEILVRCGAGGRDHSSCCQRRGIRWECLPICSAVLDMSPQAVVSTCIGDAGKIIQCMAEGIGQLPEAPEDLHTISVLPTRIHVKWNYRNTTEEPVWFEVRYTETQEKIPPHPLDYGYVDNTTENNFALKELKSDAYYSIYVVTVNEFGSSLPSLVLLVHTPERDEIYNETIEASLGPPHSLEVTHQTMDSVSVSWRSPFHVPANSSLAYLVFYKPVNNSGDIVGDSSLKVATVLNHLTLTNLTVNTQYAIAVQARTGHQESPLSETVLAWTDPAIPAFVNPPVVVPPEPIVEGANVTLLCVATGMPVPGLPLPQRPVSVQQQSRGALPNVQHNVTGGSSDNGLGRERSSTSGSEL